MAATLSPDRINGIGGSEAAAVLGLSRWQTPYQIWADKCGLSGGREVSPAMEWGTRLEPVVRQKYSDETGRSVQWPVGDEYGHMRSAEHPWMVGTLDGITADGRGLEIKTARSSADWGPEGTDDVPNEYVIQCQHYMVVADLQVFDLAVLFGGSDFRIYEVPADRELQDMIIEGERQFWELVQTNTPPAVTTYADAVRRWSQSREQKVVATAEASVAVEELRQLGAWKKEIDGRKDDLYFSILQLLEEADTLTDERDNVLLTYKRTRDGHKLDLKAFRSAHPDMYQQFSIPRPGSRRWLLKGAKGEDSDE